MVWLANVRSTDLRPLQDYHTLVLRSTIALVPVLARVIEKERERERGRLDFWRVIRLCNAGFRERTFDNVCVCVFFVRVCVGIAHEPKRWFLHLNDVYEFCSSLLYMFVHLEIERERERERERALSAGGKKMKI